MIYSPFVIIYVLLMIKVVRSGERLRTLRVDFEYKMGIVGTSGTENKLGRAMWGSEHGMGTNAADKVEYN
jgi:hypothetical protein